MAFNSASSGVRWERNTSVKTAGLTPSPRPTPKPTPAGFLRQRRWGRIPTGGKRDGRSNSLRGAVKRELIIQNPFAGLAANVRADRTRDHFVSRDEVAKMIEACPDVQWRLIVVLCRYAGLRCPSEVLALKWSDILWDKNRMTVPNEKTGTVTGEAFRVVPLFPEVRSQLEDAFGLAKEGDIHVITRYRDGNANLRTQLGRIARKAGVTLWEKPFVNMRASCATELAQTYPSYVVTKWLGHTEAVAEAHYWQVTEDHFQKAAQNPAQQTAARSGREQKSEGGGNVEGNTPQDVAASCDIVQSCSVHPTGVEPVTCGSEVRWEPDRANT